MPECSASVRMTNTTGRSNKRIVFIRAFFHLLVGMFLGIVVPLTSVLNAISHRSSASQMNVYVPLMMTAGVGLLATAFGAARWKVYVRRTAYVLIALLVIFGMGT